MANFVETHGRALRMIKTGFPLTKRQFTYPFKTQVASNIPGIRSFGGVYLSTETPLLLLCDPYFPFSAEDRPSNVCARASREQPLAAQCTSSTLIGAGPRLAPVWVVLLLLKEKTYAETLFIKPIYHHPPPPRTHTHNHLQHIYVIRKSCKNTVMTFKRRSSCLVSHVLAWREY